MILATTATVAALCSNCGEMEFQALSLFAFSRLGHESFKCHCRTPLLRSPVIIGGCSVCITSVLIAERLITCA